MKIDEKNEMKRRTHEIMVRKVFLKTITPDYVNARLKNQNVYSNRMK